ncbi:MAG TPA: NAD(P)H-hydrate dehydratase [Flavipsychrobacter sp.]|nr:NAD(P)H-hydrate dehydratase [Flavipsychrobacter sp.]
MKLLTAQQIKACDQYTIDKAEISSLDLIEYAARQCTEWLKKTLPDNTLYIVLCGVGNNGGDGLAITRQLHESGYAAKAFVLQLREELSEECQANFKRLENLDENLVTIVPRETFITDIPQHIVIVDAILGTGLSQPVSGWLKSFIDHINALPNCKIAIDLPSGLSADHLPEKNSAILKADYTLSFQFFKRSFFHAEAGFFTGKLQILDIGLHPEFIKNTHSSYFASDRQSVRDIYKVRNRFSHKGTYGHALVVGGSQGMMGAITLCAKAALRSGVGKVTALIPEMGYNIFQTQLPEAIFVTSGETYITEIRNSLGANVTGIGPGLGLSRKTVEALERFIEEQKECIVLDADALNILSNRKDLLHKLPHNSILTPHPKEFERLFGETSDSMQRLELARTKAMLHNIIIVLKDHHTVVVSAEGECWYNTTGNAGMATAGSGDVLTGMITSFLAQGYEPQDAAVLAVYLHGLAGDYAASRQSMEAMIAGDIIANLGNAFKEMTSTG